MTMTSLNTPAPPRPQPLQPLILPLVGSRLIEASAGTGKTWTIAALYLRLVLGHGATGVRHPRPLLPAEILVMTFTKAATRELSQRIRERLVEAAACFRGERLPRDTDPFLAALLGSYPAGEERSHAAWLLAAAAQSMDEAAVFTIDAWCQRMLREHAFDSGCLFDEALQGNETALLAEAARDYWRQQVYPLDIASAEIALACLKEVSTLARHARSLLGQSLPPAAGVGSLASLISSARTPLQALKIGWVERAASMRAWLDRQMALPTPPFKANMLQGTTYAQWCDGLSLWATGSALGLPPLAKGLERLRPEGLRAALKKNQSVELPAVFSQFADLLLQIAQLPEIRSLSLMHAATQVAARLQVLKARTRTYGFADLLDRLDRALDGSAGPSAQRLRQRILQQYPAMLIDEFQDTSPRQLGIFDKIYHIAENAPDRALLLIGDPKQSIYAFRGADIHSYLEARERTAGRHYVLDTNFRSTQPLVAATNGLFQRAEERSGAGAFRFRTDTAANVPFVEVAARGRGERLVVGAVEEGPVAECAVVEPPSITFCVDTELRSMTDSCQHYAQLCAYRVATWLRDGLAGFVQGGTKTPLRPADIAVLVRTGKEAATVRRALRRLGIASVYLSERDSVFATPEANDLLRLMQAVVAPGDLRLVRAALATTLLGRSLEELFTLLHSEELLDAHCQQLQRLHHVWQVRGVLSMLREALHAFDLPARCLAQEDGEGERRLTNVLQLAELLQAASAQCAGESALIHWLATQVAAGEAESPAGGADDPQLLRLESDADLVKIVTVHKAKGLEYPLVLLPFASHFKRVARGRTPFVVTRQVVDGMPQRRVVLNPTAEQCALADEDRLREDLRLLYVALTRAQHTLWVGAAAVKSGQKTECVWSHSALGFLISGSETRTPAECLADLEQLAGATAGIGIETSAVAAARSVALTGRAAVLSLPLAPALDYAAEFDRHWAVHSYSGIVRTATEAAFTLAPVMEASRLRGLLSDEPTADDAALGTQPALTAKPVSAAAPARHRFPAGAVAGDFLHRQLEWLAAERFALGGPGEQAMAVGAELRRRCQLTDWQEQADDTVELLAEVCQSLLPLGSGGGVALSQLTTVLPELEFWLPADGLVPAQLHAWCCAEILPGQPRPALSAPGLHGMLKGIADLVFEHEGRYWVLDYKSNRLGADDAAYTQQALEQAMCQHRYDVQAVIYLLALHRHLRHRLGAQYQPATHLGGAAYVFLRGLQGPAQGCVYLPPPLALLERLDAAMHSPP